jgi:peptidoglycan L-alanyl-D-glutamate endopeptidase CwlK
MPKFSKRSKEKLDQCHILLQKIFNEVIKYHDCTVTCGNRNKEEQNKAFAEGFSKLKFPKSKHNQLPSLAVDVVPYINGKITYDMNQVIYFAGFVMCQAAILNIPLRWGGDFNQNNIIGDQKFFDGVHFELAF